MLEIRHKYKQYKMISTDYDKAIVFGYIREHELSHGFINIHPLVSHKCLEYYTEYEYFSEADKNYFKISKDKKTVTKISKDKKNHSIFCNKWIKNGIAIWSFLIKTVNRKGVMHFRLESSCGQQFFHNNILKSNDTVKFYLYLSPYKNNICWGNNFFFMQINDEKKKMIPFTRNDIKYKMIVYMVSKNDCVILKQFDHRSRFSFTHFTDRQLFDIVDTSMIKHDRYTYRNYHSKKKHRRYKMVKIQQYT